MPLVLCSRLAIVTAFIVAIHYDTLVQQALDSLWGTLLESSFYNLAYFESIFVPMVYIGFNAIIYYLGDTKFASQYKIDKRTRLVTPYRSVAVVQVLIYSVPFMMLDAVIPKRFVPDWQWDSWIQVHRKLPQQAPHWQTLVMHLALSILIYDAMFFALHVLFHRSNTLFELIHRDHHHHDFMTATITNKLSLLERILLVLSANLSLNVLNAHPFTRTCFIIVFVFLLTENHAGYDFPVWYDKIVPFGWMGGAKAHLQHHYNRDENYAPFFTHWDYLMKLVCRTSKTS